MERGVRWIGYYVWIQIFYWFRRREEGKRSKKEIETLTATFPAEEKFRLTDQIIRLVRSINANITESHGRYGYPNQIKFCMNACGSLNETVNHLIDAYDCHYIIKEQLSVYKTEFNEVRGLLNGYIAYLRNLHCNKKDLYQANQPTQDKTSSPINLLTYSHELIT
jgi:four helix bundle protein